MDNSLKLLKLVVILLSAAFMAIAEELPELPYRVKDLTLIRQDSLGSYRFSQPHIPPHRVTSDGRLAIVLKKIDPQKSTFMLFGPEGLAQHFSVSDGDASLVKNIAQFPDNALTGIDPDGQRRWESTHRTVCEVPANDVVKTNPQVCGPDANHDCYRITVVTTTRGTYQGKNAIRLWGTELAIEVKDPKTAHASVISITQVPGTSPIAGPLFPYNDFFEPMVTQDGRLLVGRIHSLMTWRASNGESKTGFQDIVYARPNPSKAPCDVRQWDEFFPITHAPYDDQIKSNYPFAHYRFRDAEGNYIPDGEDLGATYPWIDRNGRNLFFTSLGRTLYKDTENSVGTTTAFSVACLPGIRCNLTPDRTANVEEGGHTRGLSVMGLWTHGKMVLIDGVLNNTDYGLGVGVEMSRLIKLYQSNSTQSGYVAVGAGRDARVLSDSKTSPNYGMNTTLIDSLENIFNYNAKMFPVTPRDVVWRISNGKATQEVAFDDYLDPNAVIISDMSASLSWHLANVKLLYHDNPNNIHIQNAATPTAEMRKIPSYGSFVGSGRIEPVALGGIEGRGLWLNGKSAIRYEFKDGANFPSDFFLSIFIDSRSKGEHRRLIKFPDNSSVTLIENHIVRYLSATGSVLREFSLPATNMGNKWRHLAISSETISQSKTNPVQRIRFYLRGMAFDEYLRPYSATTPKLFSGVLQGSLEVGGTKTTLGFRGWVDDFKLLAYTPGVEEICNHARGSLTALLPEYQGQWAAEADLYPQWAHNEIRGILAQPDTYRYVCRVYWNSKSGFALTTPQSMPYGLINLRKKLLFSGLELHHNLPRPDFSKQKFCLSCHQDIVDQFPTLTKSALGLDPQGRTMHEDPRRQPLNPSPFIFGFIPKRFILQTFPNQDERTPDSGTDLDQWIFQ